MERFLTPAFKDHAQTDKREKGFRAQSSGFAVDRGSPDENAHIVRALSVMY